MCCIFTLPSGLSFNNTAKLQVLAKPTVYVNPTNLTIQEGDEFTISCSALVHGTDTPADPEYEWYKFDGMKEEAINNSTSR